MFGILLLEFRVIYTSTDILSGKCYFCAMFYIYVYSTGIILWYLTSQSSTHASGLSMVYIKPLPITSIVIADK